MRGLAVLFFLNLFGFSTMFAYLQAPLRGVALKASVASRMTVSGHSMQVRNYWRSALFQSTVESTETPKPVPAAPAKLSELSLMEIRVGKIVEIAKHPEAESLYVEQVDVGESTGPRTIVSGLVAFCKSEDLLNRKVIVLCNLKPRALKGITSHGMLLCASNGDHTQVVPLDPPEGAAVGELISFEGHPAAPVEPGNKASKAYSKIADDFFVNDEGVATYKGTPFTTSVGQVKASLKGKIS